MAAGIKKLVIGGDYTAEQAVGYLADPQARGDYYTEGGSALIFWLASDRAKTYFALGDEVSRVKLTALLNGQHPVDGELIRRYGPNGTMVGAIDLTVSPAPKSVSALWALADNELRRELEEDVVLSVDYSAARIVGRSQEVGAQNPAEHVVDHDQDGMSDGDHGPRLVATRW